MMNYGLHKIPFLRFLLPLLLGIIIQEKIQIGKNIILPSLLFLLIFLFIISVLKFADRYRWDNIYGITVYGILCFAGMNLTVLTLPKSRPENFRIGRIILIPEEKEKTFKIVLGKIKEKDSGKWYAVNGKVLAYLEKTGSANHLEPGDYLLIHSTLQIIEGPASPTEFNFSKYCENRNIYWKTYLKDNQWKKLNKKTCFFSLSGAELIRRRMILHTGGYHLRYENLVHSLLLGYREGLSSSQQQYFVASGAMHVLAVSGLHVGIIYSMLVFIMRLFSRRKSGFMLLLPLPVIWIYALITGMAPSVSRASIMISLYVISKFLNRQAESLNIVLFSGFLMILVQPSVIHQVSFQLSFAAVAGISIVYPGLYGIMKTGKWLVDQIIAISCLSIAAQLFTFPLSMYYFHQFPNYFLITNLFAIPLTSMILIAGFVFWIFSFNATISSVTSLILDKLAGFLNGVTEKVCLLPFSSTAGISIGIYEVLVIYSMIFFLVIFFHNRRAIHLQVILICIVLLYGHVCLDKFRQSSQKKLMVLNAEGNAVINLISGSLNFVLTDDTSLENQSRITYHCLNYWMNSGLNEPEFIQLRNKENIYADKCFFLSGLRGDGIIFLQFCETKIGILTDYCRFKEQRSSLVDLDLLIINAVHPVEISELTNYIQADFVIISREVPLWIADNLEKSLIEQEIPFHNVYRSGYIKIEL